jgi:CBS domain-containing protein
MNAGEIRTRIAVIGERDAPLPAAARRMREQHVDCLVVVDETGGGRRVAGILTDRDIVTSVMAQGVDPSTLRAEDVMSTGVVTARESDAFAELLATMRRRGLRRLPVVDAQGVLVGCRRGGRPARVLGRNVPALRRSRHDASGLAQRLR